MLGLLMFIQDLSFSISFGEPVIGRQLVGISAKGWEICSSPIPVLHIKLAPRLTPKISIYGLAWAFPSWGPEVSIFPDKFEGKRYGFWPAFTKLSYCCEPL